jgi:hypothetical protein
MQVNALTLCKQGTRKLPFVALPRDRTGYQLTDTPHREMRGSIMTAENFTATLSVDQTPEEAFKAISNLRGWWSENIEGGTDQLGDEFTYRYEDVHKCKMKVTELVPGEKIVWHVLDNYFNFTEDETEWIGTDLIFEVSEKGDKTEIQFTHLGLVPEYECFDVCSNSWGFYVNSSLRALITTGKGSPNPKE